MVVMILMISIAVDMNVKIHRQAHLLQLQCNQDLLLTLTQEIRKSVSDSMDGIITGLHNINEVTELQSTKDQQACVSKRGRLPKILLVS